MRILLTGHDRNSLLGAALTRALADDHDDRWLDDPRDRAATAAALGEGGAPVDAAIHLVPAAAGGDEAADLTLLDRAGRGTYNLMTAGECPLPRLVLVTSLRPFERYPAHWRVDEGWAPRPTTAVADLAPFLAETAAREVARARRTDVVVLRLGEVVAGEAADGAPNADWLHVDDAVAAIRQALTLPVYADDPPGDRWRVFHIADAGAGARFETSPAAFDELGYAPRHRLTDALSPAISTSAPTSGSGSASAYSATESELATTEPWFQSAPRAALWSAHDRTISRRVALFGAGGPLGAVAAAALEGDHVLRLTDVRPLAAVAAGPPQSPDAPLPRPPAPPHEEMTIDVTDPAQVMAAAAGMDAILNLTVVRRDPAEAFRVNLLGAFNVMRAAVAHGATRVVHTGPIQTLGRFPAGYEADLAVPAEAPPRPGDDLYFVSKLLGQEVVRVFAEEHGLDVPCLLFGNFVAADRPPPPGYRLYPFTLSWADAGSALRQAVVAPAMPAPFVVLHANADLPHGRYPNAAAKRLLDWRPSDRLEAYWIRPAADPAGADRQCE
jgi:nucleoside-diphosphate-sugar epimerase